jgi:hypothetical protein
LEALIERLLHEEPAARGSASEFAQACEKAAERERPPVDVPVRASRSMPPPDMASRPGPLRGDWLRKQAPWLAAGASTVTSLALLLVLLSSRQEFDEFEDEPLPLAQGQEQQDAGVAEEQATGLADAGVEESLASAVVTSSAKANPEWISRELPKNPLPGQRKPPCTPRKERAINGACWVHLGMDAPCGDEFEWEGRCYMISYATPRQPTSDSEQ